MTTTLLLLLLFQTTPLPEQAAFEYFMERIFPVEYKINGRPGFKGTTETNGTFFDILKPCFADSDQDRNIHPGLYKNRKDTLESLKLDIGKWKRKFREKGKNEIKIFRATKTGDRYYVEVIINYESNLDCFFIEMDEKLKVTRYCKTGLVY